MLRPTLESPPPLRISVDDPEFANRTAQYVCDFFVSLNVRGFRPPSNQWTIIAAFVAYTRPEAEDGAVGRVQILTFGVGNKCVSNPTRRDQQVIDLHAEVLARREFEALLIEGVHDLRKEEESANLPARLESFATRTLLALASGQSDLYLYTSHMPCGAASNAAHLDRLDKEDEELKRVLYGQSISPPAIGKSTFRTFRQQAVPPLTKKPSRGDAIPTTCYSCSDKLSRYQVLGFQGGRISTYFEDKGWTPIRIRGIIVGEDFADGRGLQTLFGGKIQGSTDTHGDHAYSRMIDGLAEVFAGETGPTASLFYRTLNDVTRHFRIFPSTSSFVYSRSNVAALACERKGPIKDASATFSALSLADQARLRDLPLPIVRETLLPQPPVSTFALGCSWRAGQCVDVIGPIGVLSGSKRSKTTGEFEKPSRLCRERLKWACQAAFGADPELVKGSAHWRLVSSWMELRGPWQDWHAPDRLEAGTPLVESGEPTESTNENMT